MKKITILIFLISFITFSGCKKDSVDNSQTLNKLYKTYKNGEIDQCKFNGATVYVAGINAYDAGSEVYDKDGNKIGTCNYAWGQVDAICSQTQDCEVIYRCAKHITGQPAVDKYGLGQ